MFSAYNEVECTRDQKPSKHKIDYNYIMLYVVLENVFWSFSNNQKIFQKECLLFKNRL